jgi:hypothetical protein
MPQWTLLCRSCAKTFKYSAVDPDTKVLPYDDLWPNKPEFPSGGVDMD